MLTFKIPKIKLDQVPPLREKMLFGCTLAVVLIMVLNSLWQPHALRVQALRVELSGLEQQIAAVKKLIEAAGAQLEKKQEAPQAVSVLDPKIKRMLERKSASPTDEINALVSMMNAGAVPGRLQVKDLKVGERIDRGGYYAIPIHTSLTGIYTGVQGYMRALEEVDKPVALKSFNLRIDAQTQNSLEALLDIELYIVKH